MLFIFILSEKKYYPLFKSILNEILNTYRLFELNDQFFKTKDKIEIGI